MCPRRGLATHGFTLLELLVVICILALVFALALPRLGRLPARLEKEHCLSALRAALDNGGLRARATGQALRLVLVSTGGSSQFTAAALPAAPLTVPVAVGLPTASAGGQPTDGDGAAPAAGLLPETGAAVPKAVEWDEESLREGTREGEEGPAFTFYGNGEAGGPTLVFTVRGQRFSLDVDRLTGRPDIRTLQER